MTDEAMSITSEGVRGLLLGLALGDGVERARGSLPRRGPIEVGVGTQLATFTADALVRVLGSPRTLSARGAATALWDGTARWGVAQGLLPAGRFPWAPTPDGWISDVPVLGERRGSAPATVSALQQGRSGTLEDPLNGGAPGTTAVLRTIPTAVLCSRLPYAGAYSSPDSEFARFAALTHGSGETLHASVATAAVAYHCLLGSSVDEAVGMSGLAEQGSLLGGAREIAGGKPQDPRALMEWMHNDAQSAMAGGVYTAISFPDPHQVVDALDFACHLSNGRGAAAVAGALIGAVHGVHALPVNLVSRLELSWVLDTLGADLAGQLHAATSVLDRYPPVGSD